MRKAKQHLLVSLAIFAVAFVAVVVFVAANASGTVRTLSEATTISEEPVIVPVQKSTPVTTEIQPSESASVEPIAVETYQQPIVTPNAEQKQQEEPQLERIPFTNNPVTAGDPESYIDTYGQCPFYENAGPKGCFPPPDVECNEDWSKCEYIGDKK